MKELLIRGERNESRILVGAKFDSLPSLIPGNKVLLLTDSNVEGLYRERFPVFPTLVTEPGEHAKTLENAALLYRRMAELGVDRSWFLIGIGGGVVTDLAGFLASTYMRGLPFGLVATTLLAQVDASIGGKTGLNLDGYKNMVGTFYQPVFVLSDLSMLDTLPAEEWENGWAEIIKHGCIADRNYLDLLENNREALINRNPALLENVIGDSVRIKSEVVNLDEKERGLRRILNYGHTAGHAIEKMTGMPHGKAVALGMVIAGRLSVLMGLISETDHLRIKKLLDAYGLPVTHTVDAEELFRVMTSDKKKEGDKMHYVLLKQTGKAVPVEIPLVKLRKLMKRAIGEEN